MVVGKNVSLPLNVFLVGMIVVIVVLVTVMIVSILIIKQSKNNKVQKMKQMQQKKSMDEEIIQVSIKGGKDVADKDSGSRNLILDFASMEEEQEKTVCYGTDYKMENNVDRVPNVNNVNNVNNYNANTNQVINNSKTVKVLDADNFSQSAIHTAAFGTKDVLQNQNFSVTNISNNMSIEMTRPGFQQQSFGAMPNVGTTMVIRLRDVDRGTVFETKFQQELTIGRLNQNGNPNFIQISYDGSVSRQHCKIINVNQRCIVCDLGSTNPVKVDNVVVKSHCFLTQGQVLKLGDVKLLVEYLGNSCL